MSQLNGINHVAFISGDIDRLADFYKRIFGAEKTVDEYITHGDTKVRHAFIDIGGGAMLHPFEYPGNRWLEAMPIFDRGRIDHIAINVSSSAALGEIRELLMAEGASDGTITDFGSMLSVFFRDPDGMEAEVCWSKKGNL